MCVCVCVRACVRACVCVLGGRVLVCFLIFSVNVVVVAHDLGEENSGNNVGGGGGGGGAEGCVLQCSPLTQAAKQLL